MQSGFELPSLSHGEGITVHQNQAMKCNTGTGIVKRYKKIVVPTEIIIGRYDLDLWTFYQQFTLIEPLPVH